MAFRVGDAGALEGRVDLQLDAAKMAPSNWVARELARQNAYFLEVLPRLSKTALSRLTGRALEAAAALGLLADTVPTMATSALPVAMRAELRSIFREVRAAKLREEIALLEQQERDLLRVREIFAEVEAREAAALQPMLANIRHDFMTRQASMAGAA